jgi:hypothetical protein
MRSPGRSSSSGTQPRSVRNGWFGVAVMERPSCVVKRSTGFRPLGMKSEGRTLRSFQSSVSVWTSSFSPAWPRRTNSATVIISPVRASVILVMDPTHFPIAGLAAITIIWPGCSPLVSESRSVKPVGTPVISPPRLLIASISSRVPSMISPSGR